MRLVIMGLVLMLTGCATYDQTLTRMARWECTMFEAGFPLAQCVEERKEEIKQDL